MSDTTIDSLVIEISANAKNATSGIDEIAKSLERLKQVGSLTRVVNSLKKLNTALNELSSNSAAISTLREFSKAFSGLAAISSPSGLRSTLNALKKIPELTKQIDNKTVTEFVNKMKKLGTALTPLSTNLSVISQSFGRMPRMLNSCVSATNQYAKANSRLSGISARSILNNSLWTISFATIAKSIKDSISNLNDYVENVNLFTVSMGQFAEEGMAYAEKVQDALGVDMSEFIRNQAIFKNMADGFGLAEEKAYQLSRGMTELAYDISSFYNVGTEEVFQRLQSGIAGEIEPVRRWGIALDQASMKQWMLKEGIDANVNSLTQADKALIRYNMMVESMRDNGAIGDLARTLETPANAIRILNQQITQLSRAIGTLLIPIISKVIPYIQAFVKVVTSAAQALASLLGIDINFNVDFGSASSGVSELGDAMDEASASAKKLKDYTMGFDELNIINPNSGASGQAAGSSLDLDVASVWDEAILQNINSKVDELTKKIKKLLPIVVAVGAAFLYWSTGWIVAEAIQTVIAFVQALKLAFKGFPALASVMFPGNTKAAMFDTLGLIGKYKIPIAITAAAIAAVTLALIDLWKNSETFRDRVKSVVGEIGEAFNKLKQAVWDYMVVPLMDAFGITANSMTELYTVHIRPIVEKIAVVFVEILGGAIVATIEFFAGLVRTVGTAMGNIAQFIANVVSTGIENITTMRDQFKSLFEQIRRNTTAKFTELKDWLKKLWGFVMLEVTQFRDDFTNMFEQIRSNVASKIQNLIGFFSSLVGWVRDAISALKEFFTMDTAGTIELNSGRIVGGSVNRYATGGFIEDGLFTMNHGEIAGKFSNGQSVVANNQQIVDGIADGVYRAVMAAQAEETGNPVEVSVYLDGKQISKSVDKYNNSRGRVIMGNGLGYNF